MHSAGESMLSTIALVLLQLVNLPVKDLKVTAMGLVYLFLKHGVTSITCIASWVLRQRCQCKLISRVHVYNGFVRALCVHVYVSLCISDCVAQVYIIKDEFLWCGDLKDS